MRGKAKREIHRQTGVDRKTIRKCEQLYRAQRPAGGSSPSTMATGSSPGNGQIPPVLATG